MSNPQQVDLSPEIRDLLERLRRRIRQYIWIEGIAATLALLGAAFWIGLAFDWLFEPSPAVRVVALGLVGIGVLTVFYRYVLARIFVRLGDTSMAVLLEKYFSEFHDSLLTAVELSRHPSHATSFSRDMLSETRGEAQKKLRDVQLSNVFNFGPLIRKVSAAAVLMISIIAFGIFASGAFGTFASRVFTLSQELWPRSTKLIVDGFPLDEKEGVRMMKVARGGNAEIVVKADNRLEEPPPSRVEIRYRLPDGSRGRVDMTRIGEAIRDQDDYQTYAFSFRDVFDTYDFDVIGGDDRVRNLRLKVVDSPEILGMTLDCEYPEYTGRGARRLNVTGAMSIPYGTRVVLTAETNKDLVQVKIMEPDVSQPVVLDISSQENRKQFQYTIDFLDRDRQLLFTLLDADGIETREPIRVSITATPDEPPQVTVALKGIGTAITPQAMIPMVGKIEDDYGVGSAWFAYQINQADPQDIAFSPQANGENELIVKQTLDVRPLELVPDQKFLVGVRAMDRYNLGKEGANVGSGQRFTLEVVTPDQLRAILEGREIMLRKRFETIYEEMIDTRDLMARIDFGSLDEGDEKTDDAPERTNPQDVGSGSGDTPAERALSRRKLRVMRSVQNSQRAAHEMTSLAAAFDEIREELINNRVDTEELIARIRDGIVAPLNHIGGPMITELEKRLDELKTHVADTTRGPEALRSSVTQADAILVEMKGVLDRMLELESYNELMEVLRGIIKDQEIINNKTDQQRKKLPGIFEDLEE